MNCAEDFQQQPQVINGASDLLVELYGERGRHARSAVGMYQLPFNIAGRDRDDRRGLGANMQAGTYRLGIDIGGTFTDLVLLSDDGMAIGKVLTTPHDPAAAVLGGVRELLGQAAISPQRVSQLVHGTTLITNAIIERKGAKTGLITTRGFRDALEIGRERRYDHLRYLAGKSPASRATLFAP